MCTTNYSAIFKDFSIIIASLTAIYAIDSWRREYRGKKQIDLAEEVLALFYEAKDAIYHIRNPFAYPGEGSSRKKSEQESKEESEAFDRAYVVFERYNKHQSLFNKLYSIKYRFMAQFGADRAKPFDDIKKLTTEIFSAANVLSDYWATDFNPYISQQRKQSHFESKKKFEAIFWTGLQEPDPINPRLDKIISDIEQVCRDIITAKGTLYSLLNKPIFKFFKRTKAN